MKQLLILILSFLPLFGHAQIVINEIQASNVSTIYDDAGDYDDWVELHNAGDSQVDIGGLVLKDKLDTWRIPGGDTST